MSALMGHSNKANGERKSGSSADELVRVARRLRLTDRQRVGLIPAGNNLVVEPVIRSMAAILADRSDGVIAVVDAGNPWAVPIEGAERLVYVRALSGGVLLLTPAKTLDGRVNPVAIEAAILEAETWAELVLVDLTGLEREGEHLATISLLDGVICVARAHETVEAELLRSRAVADEDRLLGVLLLA